MDKLTRFLVACALMAAGIGGLMLAHEIYVAMNLLGGGGLMAYLLPGAIGFLSTAVLYGAVMLGADR